MTPIAYGPGMRGIPTPVPKGNKRLRNKVTGMIMECEEDYVPSDPEQWERIGNPADWKGLKT